MGRNLDTEERLYKELPPAYLANLLVESTISQVARRFGFIPATVTRYAQKVLTPQQYAARKRFAGKGNHKKAKPADTATLCSRCQCPPLYGGKIEGDGICSLCHIEMTRGKVMTMREVMT